MHLLVFVSGENFKNTPGFKTTEGRNYIKPLYLFPLA